MRPRGYLSGRIWLRLKGFQSPQGLPCGLVGQQPGPASVHCPEPCPGTVSLPGEKHHQAPAGRSWVDSCARKATLVLSGQAPGFPTLSGAGLSTWRQGHRGQPPLASSQCPQGRRARPLLIFTHTLCFPWKVNIYTLSTGLHPAWTATWPGGLPWPRAFESPFTPEVSPSARAASRWGTMLCPDGLCSRAVYSQASLTKKWGIWPRLKAAAQAFPRTTGHQVPEV